MGLVGIDCHHDEASRPQRFPVGGVLGASQSRIEGGGGRLPGHAVHKGIRYGPGQGDGAAHASERTVATDLTPQSKTAAEAAVLLG
jgi:hypothetical protein